MLNIVTLRTVVEIQNYQDAIRQHVYSLNKEERYMRFFGTSDTSIEYWLTKLVQEEQVKHIIQLVLDGDQVVGVADIAYRDIFSEAEIAVSTLASHRKELFPNTDLRLAVGLLQSVIDLIKAEPFSEIVYSTLPENRPMLELGRQLGFEHKWVEGAVQGSMLL